MITLNVWRRTPDGDRLRAGQIRVAAPDPTRGGRLKGEFRYDPGYLEQPQALALALDPIHLPLKSGIFAADRPHAGIHGVFEDSLPDAWGRGLLIRRHRLPRSHQDPAHLLLYLGQNGLGALAYQVAGSDDIPPPAPPTSPHDTLALIEAAERYDLNPAELADDDLAALFRAASSPGGARPKLIVEHQGASCIAKLGSSQDRVDLVRVEAACLALAAAAGLEIPSFQVVEFGRHPALLIERFDVCGKQGRRHMLSMQTLAGADGWYQLGYADLADLVRRLSDRPEVDLPALYRQMVFNAFIGNTDDHLKNFSLLHRDHAWRLSPAYDLTPDEPQRGEHVLHFGPAGYEPSANALAALASAFGLSSRKARQIRDKVTSVMAGWRERFLDYGVLPLDLELLAPGIELRRKRCTESG